MGKINKFQNNSSQIKTTQQTFYQGIIPPPELMSQYKDIDPSFPDRILKMTENEGEHRRKAEIKIIKFSFWNDCLGIIAGFLAVMAVLFLCYLFLINGHAKEGTWLGCAIIVGLAAVFVIRKMPNKNSK